jgi:hypothetical protein
MESASNGGLHLLPGLDRKISVLKIPYDSFFDLPTVQFRILGGLKEETGAQSCEENTNLQYLEEMRFFSC